MVGLLINHRSNSRSDHRVARLEAKYGMAGYGLYWAIVEHLANNDNAIEADIETLAYTFRCSEEMVSYVVNSSGLFVVEDGVLSCELLIEQQDKRRKLADNARKRWQKQEVKTEPAQINEKQSDPEPVQQQQLQLELEVEKIEFNHDNGINYKEFAEQWNSICANLPKVEKLTESRKRKIKARLKDWPKEKIFEAFAIVAKNDFLCGKNNRGWTATFDWIIENDRNLARVLEGAYNAGAKYNGQATQQPQKLQTKNQIIHLDNMEDKYKQDREELERRRREREEDKAKAEERNKEFDRMMEDFYKSYEKGEVRTLDDFKKLYGHNYNY